MQQPRDHTPALRLSLAVSLPSLDLIFFFLPTVAPEITSDVEGMKRQMDKRHISSYLGLLEIRHRAARRNTFIVGAIFTLSLLSFFALGMIGKIRGLELFVASAILIAFGLSFISALIRLETIKAVSEFARRFLEIDEAAYR